MTKIQISKHKKRGVQNALFLVIEYWNLRSIWPNFKIRWCLEVEILFTGKCLYFEKVKEDKNG